MNILELYSGIGGMHMAFRESGKNGLIKAAVEINPIANEIYKHNFPNTKLLNLNIEGLTADFINNLDVDTILMSPPCQPFTRNGKKSDINDARTDSFQHLLTIIPELNVKNILMENVKGFETSEMRNIFVKTIRKNGFTCQEFLLSPVQFGVPNSRLRYYCVAKKSLKHDAKEDCIMEKLPSIPESLMETFDIKCILDNEVTSSYLLPRNILQKRLKVLDICFRNSRRSCCFTKSYGRFIEGTGSVFTDQEEPEINATVMRLKEMDSTSKEFLELAESLKLRFFTPTEISKLMCFSKTFSFPNGLTDRQKYKVLGNSINVRVVSELIKLI